jgi:Glyoxalase superfamily protein
MRDFRDAKAMAQTLREALNAKAISLTVGESLELIAKVLGFPDWNVLAARIRAAGRGGPESAATAVGAARPEVNVAHATLDRYAGTYQLHQAVFTVARDQNQLTACLSGQGSVSYYAVSETEFVARDIDVTLRFVLDADDTPSALILRQNGSDHSMQRIDSAMAQQLQRAIEDRMSSRSANPGTEAALRRLVEGLASGQPNYVEMSSGLAEATRKQLPRLQRGLAELGPIKSVEFLGVGAQGQDVYSVWHQGGASHWHIALEADGTISTAYVTPGP